MAKMVIMRTNIELPGAAAMEAASQLLFRCLDGFTDSDRRSYRKFWKHVIKMEPGELANVEMTFPRLGWYHRKHMALERDLLASQDRFDDMEDMRLWLKIGSGWVKWMAGPKGGVYPQPKSISYREADQVEFEKFHDGVVKFLREAHAGKYLWPHLEERARAEMIETILVGFGE